MPIWGVQRRLGEEMGASLCATSGISGERLAPPAQLLPYVEIRTGFGPMRLPLDTATAA